MGVVKTIAMLTMEKGIMTGEQRKAYEIVKNLLLHRNLDVSKIAALRDRTQAFVRKAQGDYP